MRNHIIVCGMGHVGYRVVDLLLRLGEQVEVVTLASPRPDWIRQVESRGVTIRLGDARDEPRLREAGLSEARALIAATDQDLVNIEIALDAVRIRPELTVVVRLFDQGMAKHLEASFDIRRALGMSSLAAPVFAAASQGEQGSVAFAAGDHAYIVGRLKLSDTSPFLNDTVAALAKDRGLYVISQEGRGQAAHLPRPDDTVQRDDKLVLIADRQAWDRHVGKKSRTEVPPWLRALAFGLNPRTFLGYLWNMWSEAPLSIRTIFLVLNILLMTSVFVFHHALHLRFIDALYFVVTTVTTVGYGDISLHQASDLLKLYGCGVMLLGSATMAILFSIVTDFIVTARFQAILGHQRIPDQGHVIVVGVGNLGFHTAEELIRTGVAVVGIDRDGNRDFVEELRSQVPVLVGDGRATSVLSRAGVERADALVATTSNDLMNLAIALAAKQLNPRIRTVVRLFDSDFASKVQNILNVDVAQSDSRIAAPTFVASALEPGVQAAFIRSGVLFMVVHQEVREAWNGRTADQLSVEHNVRVLLLRRAGERVYSSVAADEPLTQGQSMVGVIQRPVGV